MASEDQTETWFLAQLKPNSLRIAQKNLERQGFKTFMPLEETTQRRSQQFITQDRPLFPGYLFVLFDPAMGYWRRINSTQGVSRLVSFGGAPAAVPSTLVAQLEATTDSEGRIVTEAPLTAGMEVKVTQGAFADFVATVQSIAPERRVWVLMDIMGKETRVAIPGDHIRTL